MQWQKNTLAEIRIIKGFVAIAFFNAFNAFGFEFPKAKPEDMGISSDRLERVSAKIQEYIDEDFDPEAQKRVDEFWENKKKRKTKTKVEKEEEKKE